MVESAQISAKPQNVKRENSASKTKKIDYSQSMNSLESPVDQVLYLQRTIGNQAVQRLIRSEALQTKLKIGRSRDKYEQEADRAADGIMQMPEPGVQARIERETFQPDLKIKEANPLVQKQELDPGQELEAQERSDIDVEGLTGESGGGGDVEGEISSQPQERESFLMTAELQMMLARIDYDELYDLTSRYAIGARRYGDAFRDKMLLEARKYNNAYQIHDRIVGDARAEAQNQNMWIGLGVGFGMGVGPGILVAYTLPATASGALTMITAEGTSIAGETILVQSGQAVVGTAAGYGLTKLLSVEGSDLQPSGLHPSLVGLRIWQRSAEVYRQGLSLIEPLQNLHRLTTQAALINGETRAQRAGAEPRVSMADLRRMVAAINTTRTRLFRFMPIFKEKLANLRPLMDQINTPSTYSQREMLQDIWILWIAQLDVRELDILDLDAIEDHLHSTEIGVLGPGSRLGVDFGAWTSDEDEFNAWIAAKRAAFHIRDRVRQLQGEGAGLP